MYCEVYLFDLPYHLDRAFDYFATDDVTCGAFVRVPFGRQNRLRLGVVMSLKETTESEGVKPVHSVVMREFFLDERMRGLVSFLREYTLCTMGEAVKCILPPGAMSERSNILTERCYRLRITPAEAEHLLTLCGRAGIRSEGQRRVLRYLIENPEADAALIRALPSVSSSNIAALVEKGLIEYSLKERLRNPYSQYAAVRDSSEIVLNRAQNAAYDTLSELYHDEKSRCAMLHGITGSGKTNVIMKTIDLTIADGRGVIMLVPEIALTPQTVGIFCKRYGERVAVIHSSLSEGERLDAYRRVRRGEVDLVIGTRSAIFAPMENVGLIVIDEEHEHTYKSESDPKYHARDVAAYLCGCHSALLLLASATPSLESFYKAKEGIYTLIQLKERYGTAALPDAIVVDMREELRRGNTSPISQRLLESLQGVRERDEQAILFLNRRGYNSQVMCRSCAEVISCPNCTVSLTYHKGDNGGRMLCHLCGFSSAVPRMCPSCGEEKLSFLGYGTQKVEGELNKYIPEMSVMRMDADTTTGKFSYDKLLEKYRHREADILLGTQMVAKGHDFPAVTLVGVVLADTSLHLSDFRANERTFSLLTQVIGRAGRAKQGGVAVIQTFSPKNEIIRLACEQDYERFYEGELALRRELVLPPFCDMVTLGVTSENESLAMKTAEELSRSLLTHLEGEMSKLPFVVFGPFEAGIYRVNEKYRLRMVIKCKLTRAVRAMFSDICREFSRRGGDVSVSIDFNPLTI